MEPRPHERGNCLMRRPFQTPAAELQWSHVLTNVETRCRSSRLAESDFASMEPRPHERGNGGRGHGLRPRGGASMEPRPHERGNVPLPSAVFAVRGCFNGATSSRTWKLGGIERGGLLRLRASMEPRPHERGNIGGPGLRGGSLKASMEPRPHERGNVARCPPNGVRRIASMEPRPHERGNRITYTDRAAGFKDCFNGATSSRTWKPAGKGRV